MSRFEWLGMENMRRGRPPRHGQQTWSHSGSGGRDWFLASLDRRWAMKKEKKLMNSCPSAIRHAGHYNQPVRTVKHTSATFHRLRGSSAAGPDRLLEKGSSDSVGKITWSGRAFAVARVTRPRLNPEHPDSWCARKNGELLQSPDATAGRRPSTHTQGWDCSHGASTTDWPTVGEDWSALNLTFQKVFPQNSCKNQTAKQWRPWLHVQTHSWICIIIKLYFLSIQRQLMARVVVDSTCGILKGMCGLWNPTAKKNGRSFCTWLFSRLMASSVLSRSGRVPPGCSVTFTAHSKLTWSRPSSPLHTCQPIQRLRDHIFFGLLMLEKVKWQWQHNVFMIDAIF